MKKVNRLNLLKLMLSVLWFVGGILDVDFVLGISSDKVVQVSGSYGSQIFNGKII